MKAKRTRDTLELEAAGGIVGTVILILVIVGVLDYEEAPVFFSVVIGFGGALNGLLSVIQFCKKNYILGALFLLIALTMAILFVLQIMILKG